MERLFSCSIWVGGGDVNKRLSSLLTSLLMSLLMSLLIQISLLINLLIGLLIKIYLFDSREFDGICGATHAKLFFKRNIILNPIWIIFCRMEVGN